jgi:hypothetical protein
MGFIEETGAAQHYRDARIMPIYEGTTAIQSNDLIGRKVIRNQRRRGARRHHRHRRGLRSAGGDVAAHQTASSGRGCRASRDRRSHRLRRRAAGCARRQRPIRRLGVLAGGWMHALAVVAVAAHAAPEEPTRSG